MWCVRAQWEDERKRPREKFFRKLFGAGIPDKVLLCLIEGREERTHRLRVRALLYAEEPCDRFRISEVACESVTSFRCMSHGEARAERFDGAGDAGGVGGKDDYRKYGT